MNEQTDTNLKKLETHRFQVPEHSAEALKQFREEMAKFIEEHPEVVGVTIYGSHLKGTARAETDPDGKSDIDCFVFVDEENRGLPVEADVKVSSTETSQNWLDMYGSIGQPFKDIYSKVSGFSNQEMKDIRFRLLSKARIDNEINAMVEYENQVVRSENGEGERPPIQDWPKQDLGRLFNLQLGKNLDEYRSYILLELQKLGSLGDTIWEKYIYKNVLAEENNKLIRGTTDEAIAFYEKRSQLFPQTVNDAIKYFKVDSVEPKYAEEIGEQPQESDTTSISQSLHQPSG